MDKNIKVKVDALQTIAKAFFDRGSAVQYDELSMDRICRITPRRELYSVPEKATKQHILFLDCSSFVFSSFYQAFGYRFEADVTSDMINISDIRVFYYEITGKEVDEEKNLIMRKFKDTLQTGDVIVTIYNYDNGHTMLYVGNDTFYHCTSNGKKGSYNYQQRRDNLYDIGAVYRVNSSVLFSREINGISSKNYLFNDRNRKFCILRPLSKIESITLATKKRIEGLKNIHVEVTWSHPEGSSIRLGEEITYKVEITNLDTFSHNIRLIFNKKMNLLNINSGESTSNLYSLAINKDMVDNKYICKPTIYVNDVEIYVPDVIFDNNNFLSNSLLFKPGEIINSLFEKTIKNEGIVYHLRENSELNSILVPGHFGGYGVISPEIIHSPDIRIHRISMSSFQPGDLIIYKDSLDSTAKAVKYYGNGKFDSTLCKDATEFIDSLFGRFCFCIIRHSLYNS